MARGEGAIMDRLEPLTPCSSKPRTRTRTRPWPSRRSLCSSGPACIQKEVLASVQAGCHWCPATARSWLVPSASGGRSRVDDPVLISFITSGAPHCRNPARPATRRADGARDVTPAGPRPSAVGVSVVEGLAGIAGTHLEGAPLRMVDGSAAPSSYRLLTKSPRNPRSRPLDLADEKAAQRVGGRLVAHAAASDMARLPLRQARVLSGAVAVPGPASGSSVLVARRSPRLSLCAARRWRRR